MIQSRANKEVTVPEPFNLTPVKPKELPEEFVVPKLEAKPVPRELYTEYEKIQKKLEQKK
jgi:hypothetical protein